MLIYRFKFFFDKPAFCSGHSHDRHQLIAESLTHNVQPMRFPNTPPLAAVHVGAVAAARRRGLLAPISASKLARPATELVASEHMAAVEEAPSLSSMDADHSSADSLGGDYEFINRDEVPVRPPCPTPPPPALDDLMSEFFVPLS